MGTQTTNPNLTAQGREGQDNNNKTMKSFKYSLAWEGECVRVTVQNRYGAMEKLFLGPTGFAQIALKGWKMGIEASGNDHYSEVSNFQWDQI